LSVWLLKIFGLLMVAGAIGMALSRAPDRPVETLVARWAPPPSDFIEVQGMAVHVRDEGPQHDAEPLVLVHGMGSSLHTWEGWVEQLNKNRRVITFDLPGFGLTGPRPESGPGSTDYSAATDARFVLELLDALKVQRFVIGGNSLGGDVAWRVAALAPSRATRLILVDAAGPAFESDAVPLAFLIARAPVLNRIAEHLLPRSVVTASVHNVYGDPSRISPILVDRLFELTLREGNRRALTQRLARWTPGEGAEAIATLRLPTLILWGGQDRLIPPDVAQVFKRDIAGSELVMFDDLGHVPHEEQPQRTVQPVLAFLAKPSQAPQATP
jgi:pimeloyl-ACP methyl ester carboxylesterase